VSLSYSSCSLAPGVAGPATKITSKETQNAKNAYTLIPITSTFVKSNINQKRHYRSSSRVAGHTAKAGYAYTIGAQDILSITVWDHPELTIPAGEFRSAEASGYPVQADGQFFFPYVGYIHAAGRTVDDIRQEITEKLTGTVINPQVGVAIAKFRSQWINITGEVKKPSTLPITDVPLTILRAISLAGGMTELADKTNLLLNRNGKVQRISFDDLSRKGNLQHNILLKDGDSLHIVENTANKVFVMGEVNNPQSMTYTRTGLTLAEAINNAKGLKEASANPMGVFVLRQENKSDKKPTVYQLNVSSVHAFLLAEQFNLRNRDIVYVTAADVTRWSRVINQLLPTASFFNSSINTLDNL
jgi:polysaccharide export outer membrane protein